jgi:hypothetical protein
VSRTLNVLFVGDVNGRPGLELVRALLKSYVQKYETDCVVVNGENTDGGKSITAEQLKEFQDLGVHAITTGNHIWDNWKVKGLLTENRTLLRPLNYPKDNPGYGFCVIDLKEKGRLGVLNLQGRTYMQPLDDPFKSADWALSKIHNETKMVLVDFHAEATAEKMALAWYLDGRVSAVVGTHTHIPTADARILPGGTAYITDVGMTGPYDSVIGMKKEIAIRRFIHQTPYKFELAEHDVRFCAVAMKLDPETGKAVKIEQIVFPAF